MIRNPGPSELYMVKPYEGQKRLYYEYIAEAALISQTRSKSLTKEKLHYYKKNFVNLVRNEK